MDNYTNIDEIETNSSVTQSDINTNSTTITNDDSTNNTSKSPCCKYCCLKSKKCKFHSAIVYLLLLSLLCLFTQMIQGGYMAAVMTNLQKQFNLSTSKIGFILSSFDVMGVIATPLLSYIGSKYNKCRVLGISGFFYVVGAVIYTLPYFIGERYKIPGVDSSDSSNSKFKNIDLCKTKEHLFTSLTTELYSNYNATIATLYSTNTTSFYSTTTTSLHTTTTTSQQTLTTTSIKNECSRDFSKTWPYVVFIIGQLFMSVGSAPLFSLGVTYLCDNLEERSHPLYTGNLNFKFFQKENKSCFFFSERNLFEKKKNSLKFLMNNRREYFRWS